MPVAFLTDDQAQRYGRYTGEPTTDRIMTDRDIGRPRGFGFDDMPDSTEAQRRLPG